MSTSKTSNPLTSPAPLTRQNYTPTRKPSLLSLPDAVLRRILAILLISYYIDGRPRGYMISSVRECNRRLCSLFSSLVSTPLKPVNYTQSYEIFPRLLRAHAHSRLHTIHNFTILNDCPGVSALILCKVDGPCRDVRILTVRDVSVEDDLQDLHPNGWSSGPKWTPQRLTRCRYLEQLLVVRPPTFPLLKTIPQLSPYLTVLWLQDLVPSQLTLVKQYLRTSTHNLTSFSASTRSALPSARRVRIEYVDAAATNSPRSFHAASPNYLSDVSLHLLTHFAPSLIFSRRLVNVVSPHDGLRLSDFHNQLMPNKEVDCYHCNIAQQQTMTQINCWEDVAGQRGCVPDHFTSYRVMLSTALTGEEVLQKARMAKQTLKVSAVSPFHWSIGYSMADACAVFGAGKDREEPFPVLTNGHICLLVSRYGDLSEWERKLLLRNICSIYVDCSSSYYEATDMSMIHDILRHQALSLTVDSREAVTPSEAEMVYAHTALTNFSNVRVLRITQLIVAELHRSGDLHTMVSRHQNLRVFHVYSIDNNCLQSTHFLTAIPSLLAALRHCSALRTVQWHVSTNMYKYVPDECVQMYRRLKEASKAIKHFAMQSSDVDCRSMKQTSEGFREELMARICHLEEVD